MDMLRSLWLWVLRAYNEQTPDGADRLRSITGRFTSIVEEIDDATESVNVKMDQREQRINELREQIDEMEEDNSEDFLAITKAAQLRASIRTLLEGKA